MLGGVRRLVADHDNSFRSQQIELEILVVGQLIARNVSPSSTQPWNRSRSCCAVRSNAPVTALIFG